MVGGIDPQHLLVDLADPVAVGPQLRWRAGNIRTPGVTAKVNLVLKKLPVFPAAAADESLLRGRILLAEGIDPIDDARITIDYEPDGLFHRALTVDATTRAGQRLSIAGRVLSFIPLRNRRGESTTHVGEGMTEWRLGERTGFGLWELLRTL